MPEFDENRYTDLMEHVARKLSESWDADYDQMPASEKMNFKQSILPIVLAVDEYREGEIHKAKRGDDVEAWIKRKRDEGTLDYLGFLDDLLDDYRLHADTATPLSMDVQTHPDVQEGP